MVVPYTNSKASDWNRVVRASANGTFQLLSKYMDYHRERFDDAGLLIYNEKDHAIGVFPANYADDNTVVSHAGLTYGGLLTDAKAHATDVKEMLEEVYSFYLTKGYKQLIYKSIPHIYSEKPCEADLYWLFQKGAKIHTRTLSSALNLQSPQPLSQLRRRGAAKARNAGIEIAESTDFETFWTILTDVLHQHHQVKPVHSLEEIHLLHSRFPQQIRLYTASSAEGVLAGTVIYADRNVAHAQYIAANDKGKACGALDLLFVRLIEEYQSQGYRWFDFGISTECGGNLLNQGLLAQKEGFGARSICYDTYILDL